VFACHGPVLLAGHEVQVLAGSLGSLAASKVGVLAFQYSAYGQWRHAQLGDVVARLDELQYACYLQGDPSLHAQAAWFLQARLWQLLAHLCPSLACGSSSLLRCPYW
jgi:hypothetical protein